MPTLSEVNELIRQRKELDNKWREYDASFDCKSLLEQTYVKSQDFADEAESKKGLGGVYGDFEIVGHGPKTNDKCGQVVGLKGCLNVGLHHNTLEGNFEGLVYIKVVHCFCHNPRCPICFKYGWAVREAHRAEERIKEGSKRFGQPEHVISSVPESDYGLTYEKLRLKNVKILYSRGLVGGALIFHGFRYRKCEVIRGGIRHMAEWYWSPHFYCVGFILGGYGKCRHCLKVRDSAYGQPSEITCVGCNGFEGRTRQLFKNDGYIVKVKGERKTVGGTFWYQLNHASINVKRVRFHCLTWFGNCSYRKLKVTPKKREELCPICKCELEKIRYFGRHDIVTDLNSPLFKRELFMDFDEGMGEVFCVSHGAGDFG